MLTSGYFLASCQVSRRFKFGLGKLDSYFFEDRFVGGDWLSVHLKTLKITVNGIGSHLARFLKRISFSHQSRQRGAGYGISASHIRSHDNLVIQDFYGSNYNRILFQKTS